MYFCFIFYETALIITITADIFTVERDDGVERKRENISGFRYVTERDPTGTGTNNDLLLFNTSLLLHRV